MDEGEDLSKGDPKAGDEEELRALNHRLVQQTEELQRLNQELIDGEQRLRLAIETGRIGLWVWNSTDVANSGDWSPRLKEIFGMPSDAEVTHELFLSCVHPEDREWVNKAVMDALAGVNGGTYQAEYRTINPKDGSLHWVTARAQAFFDPEGKPFRFIGTLMEITDRKQVEEYTNRINRELEDRIRQRTSDLQEANRVLTGEVEERQKAESALRQSESDFRKVIDAIPELVWSSLPDGQIDYLNKRWLDYTGLALDQASGWGWQVAVHAEDLPGLTEYWKSILIAQKAGEYEARLRSNDGNYRWFLFRAVPFRNSLNELIKWYGTNTDVQDLRASEHLARGQLSTLAETLESLSRETDPEQLPKHVVTTIAHQMDAHSVTVWERNGDGLDMLGIFEEGRFQTGRELGYFGGSIPIFHPTPELWSEALLSGEYSLIEDISMDPSHYLLADGRRTVWHRGELPPTFIALKDHMLSQGVRGLLISPMMLAGELAGIVGIRFTGTRFFGKEIIELMRALAHQAMFSIQLMRLSRQSRATAVTSERNRLAQEIHDTLAQGLTGIIIQLEAAEDARSLQMAEESEQHLKTAATLARESLHEARASVHALRPPALSERQLCAALTKLVTNTTKGTSLRGVFVAEGEPQRLPEAWEDNLFRMVQETLANTMRHAHATEYEASLVFSIPEVRLTIKDNGSGFDPVRVRSGLGLQGLKERVDSMAGTLTIESEPKKGVRICAVLPTVSARKN